MSNTKYAQNSKTNSAPRREPTASASELLDPDARMDLDQPLTRTLTLSKRWLVYPFKPVSLKQLNAKAEMLERLDNKYVVRESLLRQAVAELATHFDILEIAGKRCFTYETCYFDDEENSSYFDHHRGRRQRFKVRVRKYTDAQLCFVEVKLKDKRGITIKKRMDYTVDKYGTLDDSAWAHIRSSYADLYRRGFSYALEPAIEIYYQRITLVAKDGGERMTIDFGLFVSGANRSCSIGEDTFVVETKSANGNGIADKILRGLHQHPTKHCSKYCVGMAALQEVQKHNKFLPALRRFNAVPGLQVSDQMVFDQPSMPSERHVHANGAKACS